MYPPGENSSLTVLLPSFAGPGTHHQALTVAGIYPHMCYLVSGPSARDVNVSGVSLQFILGFVQLRSLPRWDPVFPSQVVQVSLGDGGWKVKNWGTNPSGV